MLVFENSTPANPDTLYNFQFGMVFFSANIACRIYIVDGVKWRGLKPTQEDETAIAWHALHGMLCKVFLHDYSAFLIMLEANYDGRTSFARSRT